LRTQLARFGYISFLPMDWSTDRFVTQISNIPHPVARVTRRPRVSGTPPPWITVPTGRGRARRPPCESVGAICPATHPTIRYACRTAKTASPLLLAPPAARDRRPEDERDAVRGEHRRSRSSRPRAPFRGEGDRRGAGMGIQSSGVAEPGTGCRRKPEHQWPGRFREAGQDLRVGLLVECLRGGLGEVVRGGRQRRGVLGVTARPYLRSTDRRRVALGFASVAGVRGNGEHAGSSGRRSGTGTRPAWPGSVACERAHRRANRGALRSRRAVRAVSLRSTPFQTNITDSA
jgi:hypothetical protein